MVRVHPDPPFKQSKKIKLVTLSIFVFNRAMKNNVEWLQKFIWFSEGVILATIALATLFAAGIEIDRLIMVKVVDLSDLFLLFIYAEVLGMVGIFYRDKRIPVTLPIIIAITAIIIFPFIIIILSLLKYFLIMVPYIIIIIVVKLFSFLNISGTTAATAITITIVPNAIKRDASRIIQ